MKRNTFLSRESIGLIIRSWLKRLNSNLELPAYIPEDAHWRRDLGLRTEDLLLLSDSLQNMFHLLDKDISYFLLQYEFWGEWINVLSMASETKALPMSFSNPFNQMEPISRRSKAGFEQEADMLAQLIQPISRIVNVIPVHHPYGCMFRLMVDQWENLEMLDLSDASMLSILTQLRKGDCIVAYPDWWTDIERSALPIPAGCLGIHMHRPLSVRTTLWLRQQGIEMLDIYGTTETGGIGYRRQMEEPYQLFPYWRHSPNNHAQLHRIFPDRSVSSAMLPPDYMTWESDKEFRLNGRRDQTIELDGQLIYPQKIAERLEHLPQVRACWIRKMSLEEGEGLKCWIIPHSNKEPAAALSTWIQLWCEQYLSAKDRPRHIILSQNSPIDQWGKLVDWPIQRKRAMTGS